MTAKKTTGPDPWLTPVLRAALRKKMNQGANAGEPDEDEVRALIWIARASRPVSALGACRPLAPSRFASSQVRGRLVLVMRSAPSRIRTCAHGSGGH
jgi:hypothetical protein